jgi:hypothetical protein
VKCRYDYVLTAEGKDVANDRWPTISPCRSAYSKTRLSISVFAMANLFSKASHSSDIRMNLRVNGYVLPIREIGPEFLVLTQTIDHPPTHADIEVHVDGHEHRRTIWLSKGLSAGQHEIDLRRPASNMPTTF